MFCLLSGEGIGAGANREYLASGDVQEPDGGMTEEKWQ